MKSAKIVFLPILFFFGLGHVSEALNYSNSFDINNEASELISKKGGGSKKGGTKKSGAKAKGNKKTQSNLNKVQRNNEAMKEEAKEKYKKWKENKKTKKTNGDLESN